MVELKPCPFCRNNNLSVVVDDGEYTLGLTDKANFKVLCGVTSMGCGAQTGWRPTEEKAIAAWNRRANDEQ